MGDTGGDDSTDALEQEWAASVVQHTWREYTERQWSKWRQHLTSDDHPHDATSDDELMLALGDKEEDRGKHDGTIQGGSSSRTRPHSAASSTHSNAPTHRTSHDVPSNSTRGSPSQPGGDDDLGEPNVDDEVVHARLESDASYKSLKAKESVLDLQVNVLLQQQHALEAQQQKLRLIKVQQERDAKERKKLARIRAKQCQELEARRQEEAEKFRALENMHIIKTVDGPPAIPKPHQKPARKRQQPMVPHATATSPEEAPIPKMKSYAKLPGLQQGHPLDDDSVPAKATPHSLTSERKAISCYAQDLTPLVNGEKPKRVKIPEAVAVKPKAKACKGKKPPSSKVKVVVANPRFDNQFDDLEPPPPLSIPHPTNATKLHGPQTKYTTNVAGTPLTAEIKHIPWASTYSKELETPLSTMQQDFEATLQSILKQHTTTPPASTGPFTASTPSISARMDLPNNWTHLAQQGPIASPSITTSTPKQTAATSSAAATVSRRDYLLNKYGKIDTDTSTSSPMTTPNAPFTAPPPPDVPSSDKPNDATWKYSSDRLQSILSKYNIATTSSASEPKPSTTQTLLAKYAPPSPRNVK